MFLGSWKNKLINLFEEKREEQGIP